MIPVPSLLAPVGADERSRSPWAPLLIGGIVAVFVAAYAIDQKTPRPVPDRPPRYARRNLP